MSWFSRQLTTQATACAAHNTFFFIPQQLNPHRFFTAPWTKKNPWQTLLRNTNNLSPSPSQTKQPPTLQLFTRATITILLPLKYLSGKALMIASKLHFFAPLTSRTKTT
jgi:hypothetical protein